MHTLIGRILNQILCNYDRMWLSDARTHTLHMLSDPLPEA
jgi:hypothetical protein